MAVVGLFPFQTVENPPIAVHSVCHAARQRAIATGAIVTRLGFTKGQNDMQVALATLKIARWKPEIVTSKRIKLRFR